MALAKRKAKPLPPMAPPGPPTIQADASPAPPLREQLEAMAKRAGTPPAQRVGISRGKDPGRVRGRSPLAPIGWDTDSAAGGGFSHPSDLIVDVPPADKSASRSKSGSRGRSAKGKGKSKKGKGKPRRGGKKGKSKGKDKGGKQQQEVQFPRKDAQKGGGAQKGKGKNK